MKIKVNENCIGCGACEGACPEVFKINDDGLSEVVSKDINGVDEEKIQEAIDGCPVAAIVKE